MNYINRSKRTGWCFCDDLDDDGAHVVHLAGGALILWSYGVIIFSTPCPVNNLIDLKLFRKMGMW